MGYNVTHFGMTPFIIFSNSSEKRKEKTYAIDMSKSMEVKRQKLEKWNADYVLFNRSTLLFCIASKGRHLRE
ncbi:Isoleucine--tRNA ligase [Dirofilaria immitis]